MRMRKMRVMMATLALLYVAGPITTGTLEARGKKEKIKARINGKPFKANLVPSMIAAYEPTSQILTVNGLFQKIRPGQGQVRTLTFSCTLDLPGATLPATVPSVFLYSDNTFKGFVPGTPIAWAGEGVSVTITSFDGTRVSGTFEGSLPPGDGATGSATITGGKFTLDLDAT